MTQQPPCSPPPSPPAHAPSPLFRFRVTYGTQCKMYEGTPAVDNYDVFDLSSEATIGDLFTQLYRKNPADRGQEWSFASPVDRFIYRYPCKNSVLLKDAFPFPVYYNKKGEIEVVADQDHLLTESATIMKDYDFMITLIKKLPIPQDVEQRKRVICCLSKVVSGIINRIRYRNELPHFCYQNCVHQLEFNKLRLYANSVADGSIFGLHVVPTIQNTPTNYDDEDDDNPRQRKRTRRENFPIEQLPEEIIAHILSFAAPKELCNFQQVSMAWDWRVNQGTMWAKFCNGWQLRTEDEEPLGHKEIVKTVYEIQSCRQLRETKDV